MQHILAKIVLGAFYGAVLNFIDFLHTLQTFGTLFNINYESENQTRSFPGFFISFLLSNCLFAAQTTREFGSAMSL
jgi:hypothetical protein